MCGRQDGHPSQALIQYSDNIIIIIYKWVAVKTTTPLPTKSYLLII
jgi:hypothetical protein